VIDRPSSDLSSPEKTKEFDKLDDPDDLYAFIECGGLGQKSRLALGRRNGTE
jgi:hypothetical protein